jgi:DNA (cytosine-5)-methyltransferase 1
MVKQLALLDGSELWRQTSDTMPNTTEHRFSLRLDPQIFCEIDQLRTEFAGNVSRNTWLLQAVAEKIQRDRARLANPSRSQGRTGRRFYEFFAGGGMARAGLGDTWDCVFANDFDPAKASAYRENWGDGPELLVRDINKLGSADLPCEADLVWASFPCQDLSLAGGYKGIGSRDSASQTRSGTFWPFWRLVTELIGEGRAPSSIVLENVTGILTANEGRDFAAIGECIANAGYRFGAAVIDARHFLPQSRPRVFFLCVKEDLNLPNALTTNRPVKPWHTEALVRAHATLSGDTRRAWLWWNIPLPQVNDKTFVDLIEDAPTGVEWHSERETRKIIDMMSPLNRAKLEAAKRSGRRCVGGVYRRTRLDEDGNKVQRAEVRFDDISGCLRTPSGGSSRQMVLLVHGKLVRSRLLSPREAARLMGLPDTYKLPANYNAAYHLAGDGVVVPAVEHLARNLIEPVLDLNLSPNA